MQLVPTLLENQTNIDYLGLEEQTLSRSEVEDTIEIKKYTMTG